MTAIIVQRLPADRPGSDIIEPLAVTDFVALDRGRQEIDDNTPARLEDVTVVYTAGVSLGDTVKVSDALQGPSWTGKVEALSHRASGARVVTVMRIRRPL